MVQRIFKSFSSLKPERVFVLTAILFSITYSFLRPPFQSADDFPHFCRAYQISEGGFSAVSRDQRLGADLPICIKEYHAYYIPFAVFPEFKARDQDNSFFLGNTCKSNERIFIDFPNTSTYSFIAYLPQSLALFVLRQFNFPIAVLYQGSKLFGLLFYVFFIFLAIKITPIYKWLFVALALIPNNLYIMNSFTGDLVSNSLAFVLIALIFKIKFCELKSIYPYLFLIFFCGVALAFIKIVHVVLLLLLFTVPAKQFPSRLRKLGLISFIVIVPLIIGNMWSRAVLKNFPTVNEYNPAFVGLVGVHQQADHHKQIAHLLEHKTHIFKVIYNSIIAEPEFYLSSYVARFGTYLDVVPPWWFYFSVLMFLAFIGLFEKNQFYFSGLDKLVLFTTGIGIFALIILSQHLVWNEVGADRLQYFQGRYLVTIFPLFFMMLSHPWQKIKLSMPIYVIAFSFMSNGYAFSQLSNRFFKEQCNNIVELTCGAEDVKQNDSLLSAGNDVVLKNFAIRTKRQHHSGSYSLQFAPGQSKGYVYEFENLKLGEFVEVFAWQKGKGAKISVNCAGLNERNHAIGHNEISYTDQQAWSKLQMVFKMFYDCDSSHVSVYLSNEGKDTVYVDDITYRIKRYDK